MKINLQIKCSCRRSAELVVSTTHLLLAIERQLLATGGEGNGQAMIFGNFAMTTTQQTEETLGNAVS